MATRNYYHILGLIQHLAEIIPFQKTEYQGQDRIGEVHRNDRIPIAWKLQDTGILATEELQP